MTASTIADQQQRQRALDPEQSFIVQAPAGSGKTGLLVQRYLVLMARVNQPEEIVAITFTRKAAAEMRARIVTALRAAAQQPAPDAEHEKHTWQLARRVIERDREQDWNVLENPGRMRIQTIDALCASLTRQLPVLSKFGTQPGVMDNTRESYQLAARRTLAHLEAEHQWSDAVSSLLAHLNNNVSQIEGLLAGMLARRDQWLRHIMTRQTDAATRDQLEINLEKVIVTHLEELASRVPRQLEEEILAVARYAAANLNITAGPEGDVVFNQLPVVTIDGLPQWRILAEILLTKSGTWRKTLNKNCGFPPPGQSKNAEEKVQREAMKQRALALIDSLEACESFRQALTELAYLPQAGYEDSQWRILQALFDLLKLAAGELYLLFQERGQVDFSQIARSAVNALGEPDNPTDLALALDVRIQHILVDEFQDTSFSQYQLLERMTAGWQADDGRTLFLVGDPMQSIYRFREAEVGLFLWARQHGIGTVKPEPLTLSVNFRSAAGVVDWVNQAFSQVLPEQENIETGAVCYAPSDSFHDHGGEPAVQIHPQYRLDQGEEAAQVLTLIRETQAASPDDTIAILVQARQHLTAIARELRLANIHFQAIEIENLSRRPVIQDLLAITRALCHPADRVAWLALLRAPWCGLSLADLHQLVGEGARSTVWQLLQDEQRLAGLSAAGRTRLARITPVLARQLAQRRRLSLCKWVEGTWLALGGPACLASERDLADVDVYLDLLDTLGQRGGLIDLEELYQRVEQLYAVPEPQQGNAVQLMTIHKAKGLEFDTVIVPGLGRKRPGGETQLLMWMERPSEREEGDLLLAPIAAAGESADPTYQYLKRVDQAKAHHEAGRLLYVAATRAKKHLHLLGHTTCDDKDGEVVIKAPDGKSLLSQLWPVVESRYLTERERRAPIDETALAPDPEGRRALRRLVTDWSLPSLPPPCPVHVAPLDIRDEKNTIDYLWASPTARHVGTLVHRFLCQMTDENLGDWNSERIDGSAAFIRDQLLQLGVPDAELQHGVRRVTQALHNVLDDERGRWILSPQVAAAENEYPLTGVIDDAIVHLVIDRTFIDERGVRWIIDYKTGVHEGADPEGFLDNERERYREQLERYARLVRHLGPEPIRLGLYFPLMRGWREWAADVGPAA